MPDRGGILMSTIASPASRPRWVAWQTQESGKRTTKVPYSAGGPKAKADDPSTWCTRVDAEFRAAILPKPFGLGGVGIELGDHEGLCLGGLDLCTCRDRETGTVETWAQEVVERFGSYAEVSPSGTGLKVFFAFDPADLVPLRLAMDTDHSRMFKRGGGDHSPAIELHLGNRYFSSSRS